MSRIGAAVPESLALGFAFCLGLSGCGGSDEAPATATPQGGSAGASAAGTGGSAAIAGTASGGGGAGGSDTGAGGGAGGSTAGAAGSAGSGGGPDTGGAGGVSGGGGGSGGTPPTDPNQRKLLLRDEGNSAVHYVDLGDTSKSWHQTVPVGRDLQLIGGRKFLIGIENGYQERNLSDGSVAKEVKTFPGTLDAHRLKNGNTLLVGVNFNGGKGIVLVEVDAAGGVARQIQYAGNYVRMVREAGAGHFLMAADTKVLEGDAQGNIVWEVTAQGHAEPHVWEALRLASGDTVVAAGYAASLQIFGADKQLKQTITGGEGVKPNFFADVQVMPGGSFVVANWQGHGTGLGGNGLQVVEYDAAGKLIWSWKQDASYVSSLQGLMVLDGSDLEKLHVENPQTGVLEPVN